MPPLTDGDPLEAQEEGTCEELKRMVENQFKNFAKPLANFPDSELSFRIGGRKLWEEESKKERERQEPKTERGNFGPSIPSRKDAAALAVHTHTTTRRTRYITGWRRSAEISRHLSGCTHF